MRSDPGGSFRDRAPTRCKALILAILGAVGLGVMIATGASADPPTGRVPAVHTHHPPAIEFPHNAVASGGGANPVISDIPNRLWNRMTGYSWTPGCPIGRSELKLVRVNFWGFDGVRSRGALVVLQGQGDNLARIFTTLYNQTFRIRRMQPMADQFGKTVRGGVTYPGADDAEAMRKDNTSAFNCRYKTFDENEGKTWSPHSCGAAIDINPWENPEEEFDNGVLKGHHPNRFHFNHRRGVGKFTRGHRQVTRGDRQVRAFAHNGYTTWGGRWLETDFMHFQNDSLSSC
jgi:hypothetical protein